MGLNLLFKLTGAVSDVVFHANNMIIRYFPLCVDEVTLVYHYVIVGSTKFESILFSHIYILPPIPVLVAGWISFVYITFVM
jgi:hypothetical protein